MKIETVSSDENKILKSRTSFKKAAEIDFINLKITALVIINSTIKDV